MSKVRRFVAVGCLFAFGAIAVASASAGGKGGFAPVLGKYTGTLPSSGGTPIPVSGTVTKSGTKYSVQPIVGSPAKCDDGLILSTIPLGIVAPINGRSFTSTQKIPIPGVEGLRTFTVKMSGHFTSEKSFTGTASAEAPPIPNNPASSACRTPTVTFTMKHP